MIRAVTVYVTKDVDDSGREIKCQGCAATKRHLTRKNVAFDEIVIDRSDESLMAALKELGHMSTPVVCATTTSGDEHWSGHRPDRIDALANHT